MNNELHNKQKLALYGGLKAKPTPYGSGKRFGQTELDYLTEALDQNTLFYHSGKMTQRMLDKFCQLIDVPFANAVSSGTAAIHTALAAADITLGDEVIISPITDTGTAIGILAQNAVPVFADIDPDSYLMTPELVEKQITEYTKAIVVIHLTGNPCDMDGFINLAKKYQLKVIEDCAQAWGAKCKGKSVGTFGDFGCYSLNDFKHIGCGDGGIVCTNDETNYRTAHAFADKYYDRLNTGYRTPSAWLGFNYRITELQSAVALAQLEKLENIANKRHELGMQLLEGLTDIPGLIPQKLTPDSKPTFWFTGFRVEQKQAQVSAAEFAKALKAEGIDAGYRYFSLLECDMFLERQGYRATKFPFDLPDGRSYKYHTDDCPNAKLFMDTFVKLPVNEFHTQEDIEQTITAVKKVAKYFF